MKKIIYSLMASVAVLTISCNTQPAPEQQTEATTEEVKTEAPAAGPDEESKPNVVQIAAGSKDHTTLVAAVKAASLVDDLSTTGPFTVFAPTNAAFDKLPKGTVEDLLKPEKLDALTDILQYHVYVGVLKAEYLQDGQTLGEVNGGNIKISLVDGKPVINGKAHILASIPASNGIIHVIDEVLIPGK